MSFDYLHVDVFAPRPFAGNSLPIFHDAPDLSSAQMLAITQELRHFEAIFLTATDEARRYQARIFDLFEELPFAGHPIIGAAAALHHLSKNPDRQLWTFDLSEKCVTVSTHQTANGYFGLLDQGAATFLGEIDLREDVAQAFSLSPDDLDPDLPLAVVSTGLRYLVVPVRRDALSRARITADITSLVQSLGAQFAVLLDEAALEVRHWNNDGIAEDVATGSAAGTIGAYRLRYCAAETNAAFKLHQGRFTGRASQLIVEPQGTPDTIHSVKVGGDVAIVGHGSLVALP
ncbi:MAG: phenazine biosynthesis protein PhzF [Sphingomonadales bacterium BRH_c3]|nr:MAG: phenazine biosynthesis protein PhzF [Sphingomonadales bacterium BRH_c3]